MKQLLLLAALILPLPSFGTINVTALVSDAESTDVEATRLSKTLKALGAKGHRDISGTEVVTFNGDITVSNGAACDNGHRTFYITLTETDDQGKTINSLTLDGSDGCTSPSTAEKFYTLLDTWGGSILDSDCGAGTCWQKIDGIECRHFEASKTTKAFDACNVKMSSGQ